MSDDPRLSRLGLPEVKAALGERGLVTVKGDADKFDVSSLAVGDVPYELVSRDREAGEWRFRPTPSSSGISTGSGS